MVRLLTAAAPAWLAACLLAAAATAAVITDYCSGITSCPSGTHTMCRYSSSGLSSSCSQADAAASSVSAADRAEILSAHNTIRRAVRAGEYVDKNLPAAAALPDLAWDAELALTAQRWADQCQQSHDLCRHVPRFSVGQNAAWTWGYAKNWTGRAVGGWFHDELSGFQQQGLTFTQGTDPVSGQVTGHLTQVIWANTTLVGCGYTEAEDSITDQAGNKHNLTKRSYFCNYGPAGNVIGQQIYQAAAGGKTTTNAQLTEATATAQPTEVTTTAQPTETSC